MINLNDSNYDQKTPKIFNKGVAGVVNNVTVTVEPNEDSSKTHAYLMKLDDGNGTILKYFNYQSEEDFGRFGDAAAAEVRYGRELKHLVKAVNDNQDIEMPQFSDYKEALDFVMYQIMDKGKGKTFRTAVCYGTTDRPSQWLRVKRTPYLESMLVPENETSINLWTTDNTERIVADDPTDSTEEATEKAKNWLMD